MASWDANFPKLNREEAELLEMSFLEEEVYKELKGADESKAPGPDRFTFKFAQTYWPKFENDVIWLFDRSFEKAEFDHHFSSSFISFILKVKSPTCLNDNRPI